MCASIIPLKVMCRTKNGNIFLAYNIHINGVFHCTVRYRQLHSLHEQLRRELGSSTLPSFPPKKLLPLSPQQTEERRASLEKYILQLSQDQRVLNNDVFNGFLVSAQNETQRGVGGAEEVPIDVYMMSGIKITLRVPPTLQTDDLLEKVCNQINLPSNLVYYFALFLVKKENNELIVVKRLQDFESPYISQKCLRGSHRIVLRKNYWSASLDNEVIGDRVGLNLLYSQTVQDVERGWILTNREIQRHLAALQAKGAKKEYLDLARNLKYYGYLQFQPCVCDFPKPDTPVLISAGNRELNFRINCEDGTVKEGNFKVTRMRCWRITVQQPINDNNGSINSSNNSSIASNSSISNSSSNNRRSSSSSTVDGIRQVSLELSFEYLMSRDEMRWISVCSPQAVLISVCLQGMVAELLTNKSGYKVRTPAQRVRKGSLQYVRRDGSSTQVTLNHTGENLSQDGSSQSPIGELSLRRLSERLSDLNILDNISSSSSRPNGRASSSEPATVTENHAFNIIGDDNL
ncbi:unnamed protein product, partial [Meganyctiphanes norvegica]